MKGAAALVILRAGALLLSAAAVAAEPVPSEDSTLTDYEKASAAEQAGDYERAAELFESAAKKDDWPLGRPLLAAATLRMALGQDDKAIAAIVAAEKGLVYPSTTEPDGSLSWWIGRRRIPGDVTAAPDLALLLAEAYERQGRTAEVVALLNRLVRKVSPTTDRHALVRAHFKLGEIAWRESCPYEATEGGCVSVQLVQVAQPDLIRADQEERLTGIRPFSRPPDTYCPAFERWVTTPMARKPRWAATAQKHFARALELWGTDPWDLDSLRRYSLGIEDSVASKEKEAARFAAAGAAFYRAERAYEDYLRIAVPPRLTLTTPESEFERPNVANLERWGRRVEASGRALLSYLHRKGRRLAELVGPGPERRGAYDHVVDFGSPYWALAAKERMAAALLEPALAIYGIPIADGTPVLDEWGTPTRANYCQALDRMGSSFEDEGVARLQRCVEAADRLMLSNDWSDLCREKLGRLRRLREIGTSEILLEPSITPPFFGPIVRDLHRQ